MCMGKEVASKRALQQILRHEELTMQDKEQYR